MMNLEAPQRVRDGHPIHPDPAADGGAGARTEELGSAAGPRGALRGRRLLLTAAGAVVGLLALVGAGGYAWLSTSNTVQVTGVENCLQVPTRSQLTAGEESAARESICGTLDALSTAWAGQDAGAYGAEFTEDATYTTFAGTYYSGREDIVGSHAALFDDVLADTQLADRFLELRMLTSEVAVLTTRGDNYEGEDPGELTKVQTYTLVREGEQWKVASFQNTQRQPVMEQIQYLWMPGTRPAAERTDG